jgi:hypothetical protein
MAPARLPARVVGLVGATVAAAVATILAHWNAPPEGAFWFWLVACFVGELVWVRLPVGQATVSTALCFQFATLLLLPRGQAMLAAATSSVLAETLVTRKPAARALFNAAQGALAVAAGSAVLEALAGGAEVRELVYGARFLPLAAAASAYFAVNTGSVAVAIALSERVNVLAAWRRNFARFRDLVINLGLFTLGALLASHYASNGMIGTLLVTAPLLLAQAWARRLGERAAPPSTPERKAA